MAKKSLFQEIMSFTLWVILLLLVFFMIPGMAILVLLRNTLGLTLDIGQMWTFAAVISAIVFIGIYS